MNFLRIYLKYSPLLLLLLFQFQLFAQSKGMIFDPASGTVLDLNGDGYISASGGAFSNDGDDTDEFEGSGWTRFPTVGQGEKLSDIRSGPDEGFTDFSVDPNGYATYMRIDGTNIIFRFRLADFRPNAKGYTVLIDTDGLIGTEDTDSYVPGDNPGFEIGVVLKSKHGVYLVDFDASSSDGSCDAVEYSYALSSNHQKAISGIESGGNMDAFYDFYVPLADLFGAGNINSSTGLRFAATTNTSNSCTFQGSVSDIGGMDDTGNPCLFCALEEIISIQTPTSTNDIQTVGLSTSCPSLSSEIQEGINVSVSGVAVPGSTVRLYINGSPDATTTADGSTGSYIAVLTNITVGDVVFATAEDTNAGLSESNSTCNSTIAVSNCDGGPSITITDPPGNSSKLQGITDLGLGLVSEVEMQIRLIGTSVLETGTLTTYNESDGTWEFSMNSDDGDNKFESQEYELRIRNISGCWSEWTIFCGASNAPKGQIPVVTSPIGPITGGSTISFAGTVDIVNVNGTDGAFIYIYQNGILIGSTEVTGAKNASGISWTIPDVLVGSCSDVEIYSIPRFSGIVEGCRTPQADKVIIAVNSASVSDAPIITGMYCSPVNTIYGTSSEEEGTLIDVSIGGLSVGTTEVNQFGTWALGGLNIASGSITATAQNPLNCETISAISSPVSISTTPSSPIITWPATVNEGANTITVSGGSGTQILYIDGWPITGSNEIPFASTNGTFNGLSSPGIPESYIYAGGLLSIVENNGICQSIESNTREVSCTDPDGSLAVSPSTIIITSGSTVDVTISGSETHTFYQLYNTVTGTNSGITGIGNTGDLTLTSSTLSANTTLQVIATRIFPTGCSTILSNGSNVTIGVAPPPTVDIQNEPTIVNTTASYTVTFEFSEAVTGFAIGDIVVGNGAASNFLAVDGNTYTADITPDGNGDITIDIAANVAQNGASNGNTVATQAVTIYDIVAPTIDIQGEPAIVNDNTPYSVTFEFSEAVTGFAIGDIVVGNGAASNFLAVDGNTYTADITPDGNGDITIDIAANVAQDGASNSNSVATQALTIYDTIAPTVDIQGEPAIVNDNTPYSVIFEFSEDVTGFAIGDIVVGNGSAGNFVAVDGNTYTADITPDGNGDITLDIAANVAQDGASNSNSVATQALTIYDAIAPTVDIQGEPAIVNDNTPYSVTFEFSEDVTGFVIGDIVVGNGSASNFLAVDGNTYTADITPDGNGDITIDIAANVAQDLASNGNAVVIQVVTLFNIITPSVEFSLINSNGAESDNSADLQVILSNVSTNDVTLDYAITGTASGGGIDYTLIDGTLTIIAGSISEIITISNIVEDKLDEFDETVVVTISNPNNATLGANTTHIYTINDNDNSPVLTASNITISEGITAVETASATDADVGDSQIFSISGIDAILFDIDPSTGELTFKIAPDYENPQDNGGDNNYDLEIIVTDAGTNTDSEFIIVSVTGINDNNPVLVTTTDISVLEGTLAVETISSTDADIGDNHVYSISGSDATLFNIDPTTGELTFKVAPDYRNPKDSGGDNTYNFEVIVTDAGLNTDSQTITVTVLSAINTGPIAVQDEIIIEKDEVATGLNLLANDSDPEGDDLIINTVAVVDVAHGTLIINPDGSCTYTPVQGFIGTDDFTYEVCDILGECSSAVVTILVNVKDTDLDNDGIPNDIEGDADTDGDGMADYEDMDSDNDRIPDKMEGNVDSDGDGIPDYKDTDSDNDGIDDKTEGSDDTDGDGLPDNVDTDSDNDGIPDMDEGNIDTDGDGIPNYKDEDSDNDGFTDKEEIDRADINADCDEDGIPNYLDTKRCDVVVSKGFSPNGDGENDYWEINGIEEYVDNNVKVFNRWGNLVFELESYNNDHAAWIGQSEGSFILGKTEVPDGTYFYMISLGDGKKPLSGYVIVKR